MENKPQTPPTKVAFNVYIPIALKTALEGRAKTTGLSMSSIIRQALNSHINHTVHRMYTCPDESPCRCPTMFQPLQQPQVPIQQPLPPPPTAAPPTSSGG